MPPSLLLFQAAAAASVQFVCIVLVSLFLVCCCIPSLHQPVRELVRPWVVFHVEGGLPWVAWAQQYQGPWLTQAAQHSDKTVSVPFYVSRSAACDWGAAIMTACLLLTVCVPPLLDCRGLCCRPSSGWVSQSSGCTLSFW